jgi:hypothetical protein
MDVKIVRDDNTGLEYLCILERVMPAGEGGRNGLGRTIDMANSPSRAWG